MPGRSLPSGEVGAPSVFRNQWERVGVGRRKGTRADRREKEHTSGRDVLRLWDPRQAGDKEVAAPGPKRMGREHPAVQKVS